MCFNRKAVVQCDGEATLSGLPCNLPMCSDCTTRVDDTHDACGDHSPVPYEWRQVTTPRMMIQTRMVTRTRSATLP